LNSAFITGYERDTESSLDFAEARYYNFNHGRFTSPDPALISARTINPQTLNRYVYVLNNPLLYVDPFGLWELQYEPEYKKNKDGTYDTSKVVRIKVFFVKTKDDDNADSLLKQLGFNSENKGYADMKSQIEGAISNMDTSEFGTTGILASSLQGKVDGVNIGKIFGTIEILLGEQANYDVKHPGAWNDISQGASNSTFRDCTSTTAILSFGATGDLSRLGTQDGETGMDSRFISRATSIASGDLRLGDVIRYGGNGNPRRRHYMTAIFTGDDGMTQAFSRSGEGGKFHVIPVTSPLGIYGNVQGTNKKHTGYYRP
jgi:RHS repeat-associated protein